MSTSISERMREKGFTSDAALAAVVGCERSMVTRVKLGKATPSLSIAVKLGAALDLPVDRFIAEPVKADEPKTEAAA